MNEFPPATGTLLTGTVLYVNSVSGELRRSGELRDEWEGLLTSR